MIVFLDFDGVLRRKQAPLYGLEPALVRAFEDAFRRIPGATIVITSTWREAFSLAEMKKPFSPDVSERIVGVTPKSQSLEGHFRHREVLGYLRRQGRQAADWVALDDDPLHYPPTAPVILTDPSVGFDDAAAQALLSAAVPGRLSIGAQRQGGEDGEAPAEALDAIHEEAVRLLAVESSDAVRAGLERIAALARNGRRRPDQRAALGPAHRGRG